MFDRGLVTATAYGHFNPALLQPPKLDKLIAKINPPADISKYTNLGFQAGYNRRAAN